MKPFFFLLDGALNYDCSSCKSVCCRGGYGTAVMHGPEWAHLKQKYPMLSHFAIDQGKYIYLINHGPRCFFLNHQYLCQIEQENGRGSKPLQCRIFPYQVCGQVHGRALVRVGLLCPFTISEDLGGNIRSENFYREVGDASLVEKVYDIFNDELSSYLSHPFALEKSIIESSGGYFQREDPEGFLFDQLAKSHDALRETGMTSSRTDVSSHVSSHKIDVSSHEIMEKMIFQQCRFIGIDLKDLDLDRKATGRVLIGISPVLRSLMLERHPYFQVGYLLALYLYSLISKQIQRDYSSTVQAIASINRQLGGKLEYLALFPFFMVPKCSPKVIKDTVKSLLETEQARGARPYAPCYAESDYAEGGHTEGEIRADSGDLTGLRMGDMAWAFQSFVEDLLGGEIFGSAACHHFHGLCELGKNQVIEYYIHHLSSFFTQALDEEAFLSGEKRNRAWTKMTQQSV